MHPDHKREVGQGDNPSHRMREALWIWDHNGSVNHVPAAVNWPEDIPPRKQREHTAVLQVSYQSSFLCWLAAHMGVPLEEIPHDYGQYFEFLRKTGVEIYGNQTMMLLYKIDPSLIASAVTPIPLSQMVQLFTSADQVIVY